MNIFKDYVETIESAMNFGEKAQSLNGIYIPFDGNLTKGFSANKLDAQTPLPSLKEFAKVLNIEPDFSRKLGAHPDFAHLKATNQTEKHYIVSMFIDLKGSTNLYKRYFPETVLTINDTVQKVAIHIFSLFGGYVHRLQGDGLFVYFGGKGQSKNNAVNQALIAASIFSYFIKIDLKKLFDKKGIKNISTRIGIDLGHEPIWFNAGIGEVSEVTTSGLHTNLASKMQANAESNGIVVGDHIKEQVQYCDDFTSPVCQRTDKPEDRYIFEITDEKFRYTQYDFHWFKFLKTQDFIAYNPVDRSLSIKKPIQYQNRNPQNIKPLAAINKPYFTS